MAINNNNAKEIINYEHAYKWGEHHLIKEDNYKVKNQQIKISRIIIINRNRIWYKDINFSFK